MATEHEDDIVRLATATNPFQAHVWEQALKRAGIRCKVVGDYLDAGFGDVPGVRAEIWVHRDDLAQAQRVINEGEEAFGSTSAEEEEPPAEDTM
jgi:hypothetical protein